MAATVTTPYAVPGNVTTPVVPSAAYYPTGVFVDAMHLVFLHITAAAVKHLAITPPISRWDGTSWVRTYSPTA